MRVWWRPGGQDDACTRPPPKGRQDTERRRWMGLRGPLQSAAAWASIPWDDCKARVGT